MSAEAPHTDPQEAFGKAVKNLWHGYTRYSGWTTSPYLAALTHAGAGAGLGYLFGYPLAERLAARLGAGPVDPEMKQKIKKRMMLLGAIGGGAIPLTFGLAQTFGATPEPDAAPKTAEEIGISTARGTIIADPHMTVYEKVQGLNMLDEASRGRTAGIVSYGDMVRAAVGAGMGYAAASVLGTVLAMPPAATRRLSNIGILGGILANTGIIG